MAHLQSILAAASILYITKKEVFTKRKTTNFYFFSLSVGIEQKHSLVFRGVGEFLCFIIIFLHFYSLNPVSVGAGVPILLPGAFKASDVGRGREVEGEESCCSRGG